MFVCCCYIIMCGIESDRCGSIRLLFPSAFLCVMPVHNMLYLHPLNQRFCFAVVGMGRHQSKKWGKQFSGGKNHCMKSQFIETMSPNVLFQSGWVPWSDSNIKYFSQWGIICISVGKLRIKGTPFKGVPKKWRHFL